MAPAEPRGMVGEGAWTASLHGRLAPPHFERTAPELSFDRGSDLQWWSIAACAQPVYRPENIAPPNQPFFQSVFAGKVQEQETHEQRQQSLARQDQHRDTSDHQKDAKQVFADEDGNADKTLLLGPSTRRSLRVREIVRSYSDDQGRNDYKAGYKERDRSGCREPKQSSMISHPVEHSAAGFSGGEVLGA